MILTRRAFSATTIFALAASLAACAQQQSSSRSRASAATRAACRHRADDVYNLRNRDDIYRADNFATNDRDSPFATTGVPGNTSAGLSSRYQRAEFEDECLSSTGGSSGGSTGAPDAAIGSGAAPVAGPAPGSKPGIKPVR